MASSTEDASMVRKRQLLFGSRNDGQFSGQFVDGYGAEYSKQAQAWRYLGVYIDCRPSDKEEQENEKIRRRTEENQEGNQDQGGDANEQNRENEDSQVNDDDRRICSRYALWAAYADIHDTGGGLSQYAYLDPDTNKWDKSACENAGIENCIKMDCHLPNSENFELLGYYKQYNVNEFLESLVRHHGSCTWEDNTQQMMANTFQSWPEGCTYIASSNNQQLYIDIKPLLQGQMSIGLYEDKQCTMPYEESSISLQQVLHMYASGSQGDGAEREENDQQYTETVVFGSDEYFEKWNMALGTYKTCQPCMSSSIYSFLKKGDEGRRRLEGDGEQDQAEGEKEGEGNGEQAEDYFPFQCEDSDGAVNVNQCMLFATETEIAPAYFRDIQLATRQGSIARSFAYGITSDKPVYRWFDEWGFLTFSLLTFALGLFSICCVIKIKTRVRPSSTKNQPLIEHDHASKPRSRAGNTPTRGSARFYPGDPDLADHAHKFNAHKF